MAVRAHWGIWYGYLLRHVAPTMVDGGIPESAIHRMRTQGPQHALSRTATSWVRAPVK